MLHDLRWGGRNAARASCAVFVICALVTGVLEVRPFTDVGERFIGHADGAEVALAARNMAEGRGAVAECVWLLHAGGLPGNQVTRPLGYWSVYVAGILSVAFRLLGANRVAVLFVACLVKTGIAAVGSFWTFRLTKSHFAALVAGLFLLSHPSMIGNLNGLSDIYLTFFILLATSFLCWAVLRISPAAMFLCGLLIGVAVGVKPTGLLMLGVVIGCVIVHPGRLKMLRRSWLLALGLLVGLAPLLFHNATFFDLRNSNSVLSLLWPEYPIVAASAKVREISDGDHNRGFYDPTVSLTSESDSTLGIVWRLRRTKWSLETLLSGALVPVWFLPFVFAAFCGFAARLSRKEVDWTTAPPVFLTCTAWLLCGGVLLAGTTHLEIRYWNFWVPMLTVVAIVTCTKFSRTFLLFAFLYTVIVGADAHWAKRDVPLTPASPAYQTVREKIPAGAVIMTQNPWETAFHTRHPCVVLPYTDRDDVVRQVAARYGARYLVVVDQDTRHPHFDDLKQGRLPDYLREVFVSTNLVIGEFVATDGARSKQRSPPIEVAGERVEH